MIVVNFTFRRSCLSPCAVIQEALDVAEEALAQDCVYLERNATDTRQRLPMDALSRSLCQLWGGKGQKAPPEALRVCWPVGTLKDLLRLTSTGSNLLLADTLRNLRQYQQIRWGRRRCRRSGRHSRAAQPAVFGD